MSNKRTYNYLSKEKAVPCPTGSKFKDKNILVKDGNNLSLKKVGVIDTVEQIQSYRDGVDLQKMIARFQRGDESALSRGVGFYADVSGFSTDLHEVMNNTRSVVSEIGNKNGDQTSHEEVIAPAAEDNNSENGGNVANEES